MARSMKYTSSTSSITSSYHRLARLRWSCNFTSSSWWWYYRFPADLSCPHAFCSGPCSSWNGEPWLGVIIITLVWWYSHQSTASKGAEEEDGKKEEKRIPEEEEEAKKNFSSFGSCWLMRISSYHMLKN